MEATTTSTSSPTGTRGVGRWCSAGLFAALASLVMGLMQQDKVDPFRGVVGEAENGGHYKH